ncbi:MAG: hypothetical protein GY771_01540, partial [bacterium]|nr:hypothetical protein [bacterium]
TYNVADAGSYTINVMSPWFESQLLFDQVGNPYTLAPSVGKIPEDFDVPVNSNVWVINFEYLEDDTDFLGARSPISAFTRVDDISATFNVAGGFNVSTGERVCLGVMPSHTQNYPLWEEGDDPYDLYLERVAKDIFPRFNGAININRVDYSYDRLIDEPENNRVKLENFSATRFQNTIDPFPLTVSKTADSPYTGEFIVLLPRNHMVIPTGTSGSVSYGGDYDFGTIIYNTALEIPPPPDIDADEFTSNITENETSSSFAGVNTDADTLNTGGGPPPRAH